MDRIPLESSLDARSFSFSRKFRWMMIGCEMVLIGFTSLALLLPFVEQDEKLWIVSAISAAFFGSFVVVMVPILHSLRDVVRVGPDGISYRRPGKPEVFLRWTDVAEVRPRDGLQRLELFDRDGCRRIKIEYQLEHFEELDRLIRDRMDPAQETFGENAGPVEFVMGRPARFGCVAGTLTCAAGAWFSLKSDPWTAAFFAGFALICLGIFLWAPHLLVIHDDRLVLRSRLRERPIFFRELIDVKLEYVQNQYSNVTARIQLQAVRGKPIHLGNFTAGAAPVFRHIRSRREKWVIDNRE